MQLNCKYRIRPGTEVAVLDAIDKRYLSKLTSKQVEMFAVFDEYYQSQFDVVAIQRLYKPDQITGDSPQGKPYRIHLHRETAESVERVRFGFVGTPDVREMLSFLGYTPFAALTQMRTSFFIADDLIQIPVTLNRTREVGMYLEVGNTAGPISNIEALLHRLAGVAGVSDDDAEFDSYPRMLMRGR